MRKLALLVVIAFAFLLVAAAAPAQAGRRWTAPVAPPAANVAGVCTSPGSYNMRFADRYASYIGDAYFDRVVGTATVQDMGVCIGGSSNPPRVCGGGTWTLPANVQNDQLNHIYQLGFGRCAGELDNHFIYALDDAVPHYVPNGYGGPLVANNGDTYTFTIYKRSSGYVSYQIYDNNTTSYVWTWYPTVVWDDSVDHAWWGYEVWDHASELGHSHGDGQFINLRAMIYNGNNDNVDHYRQPSAGEIVCYDMGCDASRHTHIKSITLSSDTIDGDTQ